MSLPVVVIVGRPNVGKSSLLNCLARKRIGIVDPTPGVTRDRISTILNVGDVYFELVDTGGFGIEDKDNLTEHIEQQIGYAISQASLVLFVVDVRDGLTPLDQEVTRLLRSQRSEVVVVANKVDTPQLEPMIAEFHRLGFGDPMPFSAHQGYGRTELLERIARFVGPQSSGEAPEPVMKVAVVGKRNVGKSTFINALAGEERVIVSEIPGTTRDSVDVRFEKDGKTYVVIDTAGVRKRSKIADDIEFYSFVRTQLSIARADVVLMLIDAAEPTSQVDKKLAHYIADQDKPCILVVNKWDLAKGKAGTDRYEDYLTRTLPMLNYSPISVITAKDNIGVAATIDLAMNLFKQAQVRVGTSELNAVLEQMLAERVPSAGTGGRPIKIYYATQISVCPPTIVLFLNHPDEVREEYRRFVLNRFRSLLPYSEIPIRLLFRSHRQDERPSD